MKGAKITLAVVMGAIVVGLCILLGYSLGKMVPGRRESGDGDIELVREREFPADDISKLDIHYEKSCNDVIIYTSEGDTVIVREFANYAVRNSELAESEGLQFEMNTKSGTIDTVFDDVLSFSEDGSHAEGTIGDAGINKVDIFTLSGDIRVQ